MNWQDKLLEASRDPETAKQTVGELIEQEGHDNEFVDALGPWLAEALKAAPPLPVELAKRLVLLAHQGGHPDWLVASVWLPLLREDVDWLVGLDEETRRFVAKFLSSFQRRRSDWEELGIITTRALLEGVDASTMHRQMIIETIDTALERPLEDLNAALTRLAHSSFSMEWTSSRFKQLSSRLENMLFRGKLEEAQHIVDTFSHARHRMTYADADLELALRHMVALATKQGPTFFAQYISPLLDEIHVTDPRLVEALTDYRVNHEGLVIETEPPPETTGSRYYSMARVSYYDAPCRFIERGRADRPAWWRHDWQGGERLDPVPEAPLSFMLEPLDLRIDGAGEALPLLKLGRVPLMHERLVTALEELGVAMQTVPAVLVEPDHSERYDGYFAVNVLGTICPERLGRFHGRLTDPSHVPGTGFELVEDIDEPIDGLLCAWIEDTHTLVVFESLRDALITTGFDELQFYELEHIAI